MKIARLMAVVLLSASAAIAVEIVRDVKVTMRDGVRLGSDLYLPSSKGQRFPTLVSRTPYNRSGMRSEAEWYTQRGYAVVVQDVRGRFGSEGEFYPFTQEGPDGYDTIEWAAAQEWSNGKVGTFGASYLAWDQYLAAMERPPHLVAMFANVGGANFYQEFAYPGGALNLGWALWILKSAETSPQALARPDAKAALTRILESPGEWFKLEPRQRAAVFDAFPVHRRIYEDFLAHTKHDAYWRNPGFHTPSGWARMKDVPILFISGWYDYFGDGLLSNASALARMQKTPKKLVMGPWWHAIGSSACGDAFFGDEAALNVRELTLDWFDHWLKGAPLSPSSEQPVRYFRMGGGSGGRDSKGRRIHGGEWRNSQAWPLPNARPHKLYFSPDKSLKARSGAGSPLTFTFDPAVPVPTIGGRYGMGAWSPNCFQDQVCRTGILGCKGEGPLASRGDVLSFSTEPLTADMEVTGPIRVRLWVSTDAPDTDFTAKLIDVAPDGYAAILNDGQLRLRYRNGFDKARPLTPGQVAEITIELGATSNLFAKGHSIRVDISSSNWPRFESNPNTGAPVNAPTAGRKARNTVYIDSRRPSHIELPVVPTK